MPRHVAACALCALFVGSCSFTTATGFEECKVDTDCSASSACLEHYCIKLPDGCKRGPGAFEEPGHIAFAAVLPLTTDMAGTARDESEFAGLDAFTQALEEMNQRMGVNNHSFSLWVCDTNRDAVRAGEQARWMATQAKVPAILSSGSAQTTAIYQAVKDSDAMVMSATSTSPELVDLFAESGGRVWRTAPPDTLQGRVLADLLLNEPQYSASMYIGIVYVDDTYGQGLNNELTRKLKAPIRTVKPLPIGPDAGAVIDQLRNFAQVTVLIAVASDADPLLRRAFTEPSLTRDAGHKWIFADASKDPTLLTIGNARSELAGSLGTAPAQGAGSQFPTFRSAYLTKYGKDPNDYAFTSHSYDAMYLLGLSAAYASAPGRELSGHTMAEAMNLFSSGSNRNIAPTEFTAMRNLLAMGVSIDVEGTSGKLDFIPDAGAPTSLIEVWRIEADGGSFTTVRNVDPPKN